MKTGIEAIQIWSGEKAPECYTRLLPNAAESEWVAVVSAEVIVDFGRHLVASGYRVGVNIKKYRLSDGRWIICGGD